MRRPWHRAAAPATSPSSVLSTCLLLSDHSPSCTSPTTLHRGPACGSTYRADTRPLDRLDLLSADLDERTTPQDADALLQRLDGGGEPRLVLLGPSIDDGSAQHWIGAAPALGGPHRGDHREQHRHQPHHK